MFVLSSLNVNRNQIRSINQIHTVDILSLEDQQHQEL